jgi:hypothetical protein
MQESDFFVFITIILTALTAFFTLVTGALAVGVTSFFTYSKKLRKDREDEIKKFSEINDNFEQQMMIAEKKLKVGGQNEEEYKQVLEDIKRDYRNWRNQAIHSQTITQLPTYSPGVFDYGPTNAELGAQIDALLSTIAELQRRIGEDDEENQEKEDEN